MEHLEIEFKMLLKENIFKKYYLIIKINQRQYQQTNYYLFHPHIGKGKNTHSELEKKKVITNSH